MKQYEIIYDDPEYDEHVWCKAHIFLGQLYFSRGVKISDRTLDLLKSTQDFLQYHIDRKRKLITYTPANNFDSLFFIEP